MELDIQSTGSRVIIDLDSALTSEAQSKQRRILKAKKIIQMDLEEDFIAFGGQPDSTQAQSCEKNTDQGELITLEDSQENSIIVSSFQPEVVTLDESFVCEVSDQIDNVESKIESSQ